MDVYIKGFWQVMIFTDLLSSPASLLQMILNDSWHYWLKYWFRLVLYFSNVTLCPDTVLFQISSFQTMNLYILKPTIIFADLNQARQPFMFFIFGMSLHISVVFLHFTSQKKNACHLISVGVSVTCWLGFSADEVLVSVGGAAQTSLSRTSWCHLC